MRIKQTSTVYLYSISVCMGSFVFGYQLSSFGNLQDLITNLYSQYQNEYQVQRDQLLLGSILALAAIFGVSLYRFLMKAYGFCWTFKFTDYLTIVASLIGVISLSYGVQFVSRVLFGFAVGINTIIIPTYLTSVLPGSMGGPAGTLNQLFITIGIFIGFYVGNFVVDDIDGDLAWRMIVAVPILPCLIRLSTVQNTYPYQTVQSMIENHDDVKLQHYLDLMYEDVTLAEFKEMKRLPLQDIQSEKASFYDPVGQPYRKRLYMAAGIIFFNQLSGGAALATFGGSVVFPSMGGEGDKEEVLHSFVLLNLLQVVVTLISGQLLQKYGRRNFMMQGIRVIAISLLLMGFIQTFVPSMHSLTGILIFVQMIGFSLSYGPCSFLIGTEIMHDILYPSMLLWIFIFLNNLIVGAFIDSIGFGPLCLIYFIIQMFGYFFISGCLVETQGRSRREVYAEFRNDKYPHGIEWLRGKADEAQHRHLNETEIQLIAKS